MSSPEPAAGPPRARVSIVIPCRNEEAHLPNLFDALLGQDAALHEIIVLDKLATGGAAYRHADHITTPTEVDTVPFGCYRRSLWTELGGYDERLQVNEDYVFNYKARLAGWSVVLDPAIRSTYVARETFGRLA